MRTSMLMSVALLQLFLIAGLMPCIMANERIRIAVSIEALRTIIAPIGESLVEIDVLLPEGVEPHLFQVSPSVIERAELAELIVHTGHFEFEYKLVEVLNKEFLGLEDYKKNGLILLNYPGTDKPNIHGYWLYPDNALAIAKTVTDKLIKLDPAHSEVYKANFEAFKERLAKLKSFIARSMKERGLTGARVITAAPAEQYLAASLGLNVMAFISREHNVFLSGKELQDVESKLREGEYLFILMSDVSEAGKAGDFAEQISADTNRPLIKVKVLSSKDIPDYFSLMTYNLGLVISSQLSRAPGEGGSSLLMISTIAGLLIIAIFEGFLIVRLRRGAT